jgi:hypothetical protein
VLLYLLLVLLLVGLLLGASLEYLQRGSYLASGGASRLRVELLAETALAAATERGVLHSTVHPVGWIRCGGGGPAGGCDDMTAVLPAGWPQVPADMEVQLRIVRLAPAVYGPVVLRQPLGAGPPLSTGSSAAAYEVLVRVWQRTPRGNRYSLAEGVAVLLDAAGAPSGPRYRIYRRLPAADDV